MTPLQQYQQAIASGELQPDSAQAEAAEALDALYHELLAAERERRGFRERVRQFFGKRIEPVRGLYIYGGVGTGKTHLFDLFYDALPFDDKLRLHFHRFMYLVHDQLRGVDDVESPLERVAAHFAGRARVLCLDEMHVNDITDAMIMGNLLRALFARGVTLVTTSNVPPFNLYRDGLQREQFLPAINLLEHHTHKIELDSGTDWRLRALENADTWHVPPDAAGDAALEDNFARVITRPRNKSPHIWVNSRQIPVIRWTDGAALFEFEAICDSPRSSDDYLEIARFFHTVLIRAVPIMDDDSNNAARRFINLVDTLYDRHVRLFASAEAEPESLYQGRKLAFEFQRTASRLAEMQTREYAHGAHKA